MIVSHNRNSNFLFVITDAKDVERYDTTIAIPTNLKDGFYSLQVSMLVGNGGVYNSCGKLKVTGGNQGL